MRGIGILASAGALSCGLLSALAMADAPTELPEIIVTAQKRGEALDDVPMAVNAFRGEDLKTYGITDTRDLGKLVPGFTAADSGFDTPIFTLRGVGFADSSFAATSTVGLYADEVSLAYPIMGKGPNFDLRRVEVLKGPQGTLYGRNATGGAINYIANTPTAELVGGGDVTYGSFGRVDTQGYISGPISDSLRARVAAISINSTEGWQTSATRPHDHLGTINKQAARGILDWQASDNLQLRLTLSGWQDKSEPQAPFAVARQAQFKLPLPSQFTSILQSLTGFNIDSAFLDPSVANYPLIPDNRNARVADWNKNGDFGLNDRFWMGSLRPEWIINDNVRLVGLFAYEEMRADGSKLPQGGLDVEDIDQVLYASIRSLSGELRLEGSFGERGTWIVGVNANRDKHHEIIEGHGSENSLNMIQFGDTAPLNKPLFFEKGAAKGDTNVHSDGIFANTDLPVLDTLTLTLGARYTRERQQYAGCTYVLADNDSLFPFPFFTAASFLKGGHSVVAQGECGSLDANANAGLYTGTLPEHNVSYRSVLSWTPANDTLFYGSYSRGYKSGGFPTIFSVDQASLAPVVQEKLDAYEVGAKIGALNRTLQINAALFYYDYGNKQLLTYFKDEIFGALQYLQNVPKSREAGAELAVSWVPVPRLHLNAAGSYIRSRVIRYEGKDTQGNDFNFTGQEFNYTPRLQASVLANYTAELNDQLNLTPGIGYSYTGGSNSTLEHDPLYTLNVHQQLDAQLALSSRDGIWSLTAFGRNLTDSFYRNSVIKLGDTVFAYAGQPRTLGLSLRVDLH